MCCSFEYVKKLANLKLGRGSNTDDGSGNRMRTLTNIVSFEDVTDADTLKVAKEAGIAVYSYN
jgi:hypothetical protein